MAKLTQKQKLELTATARDVTGRKVRHLRTSGTLPAVLYGRGQEPLSLAVPTKDFATIFKKAGESTLVFLTVGSTQYPTIIHDVAKDPVSGQIIHADFYKVRLDEKIKTMVPVVFIGEAEAVKSLGGIFVRNINELEVEALPADLPHEIQVDIMTLKEIGDQIQIKDLTIAGVRFLAEANEIICTVIPPKSEAELQAELEAPTTDISAVKEIEKEKPAEEIEEEGSKTSSSADAKSA